MWTKTVSIPASRFFNARVAKCATIHPPGLSMEKERVLLINDHTERTLLLEQSLASAGYDVMVLHDADQDRLQHCIDSFHPDYLMLEDEILVPPAPPGVF